MANMGIAEYGKSRCLFQGVKSGVRDLRRAPHLLGSSRRLSSV
jgi:hypothetical protein